MKKFFRFLIEQVFPTFSMQKVNKQLKEKINNEKTQSTVSNMVNIDAIPIDSFRKKYAETFEVKNRFEDKAKTNVIGITIAITVIMGTSSLTGSIISKYPYAALHWLSFAILLASIIYLIVSGIAAIDVLFNENTMSIVDLPDLSADNHKTKVKYDDCTSRNINRNIVRNNIVNSSYICIRNALICMMVLFVLVSVPASFSKGTSKKTEATLNGYTISYNSTITMPNGIDIEEVNNCIIQDVTSRSNVEDGSLNNFVDMGGEFFAQYKCIGSEIIVECFYCFDNVLNQR